MSSRGTLATVVILGLGAATLVAGCTEPGPTGREEIVVSDVDGPFEPLAIEVDGLRPGRQVRLESTYDGLEAWATFDVPEDGRLDLAAAQPVEGTWSRPDAMGPFWSMRPGSAGVAGLALDGPYIVELTVLDGDVTLASTTVTRPGLRPEGVQVTEVRDNGLIGVYALPRTLAAGERRPAVLAFGGSEGGLAGGGLLATQVASLGYPALGIAYFGEPGLPPKLENVAVEEFLTALEWLRGRPEVDSRHVLAFGASRGGELALWLAAHRGDLVEGAIAPVGADRLIRSPTSAGPAWTLDGEPLPYADTAPFPGQPDDDADYGDADYGDPDYGDALIPVEAIAGPIVLACGGRDELWNSCALMDRIIARLGADADVVAIREDLAGHYVALPPYLPQVFVDEPVVEIATATHAAQVRFWEAVARVLAQLG